MANIKSQIKRIETNEKRHVANVAFRSSVKLAVKKVNAAIATKDVEEAKKALASACERLDKGACKGVMSKQSAAHTKSHLTKAVNAMAA